MLNINESFPQSPQLPFAFALKMTQIRRRKTAQSLTIPLSCFLCKPSIEITFPIHEDATMLHERDYLGQAGVPLHLVRTSATCTCATGYSGTSIPNFSNVVIFCNSKFAGFSIRSFIFSSSRSTNAKRKHSTGLEVQVTWLLLWNFLRFLSYVCLNFVKRITRKSQRICTIRMRNHVNSIFTKFT